MFHYDENDSIFAITYNNGTSDYTYQLLKNLQGDVVAILNAANSVIATYEYDAWGNLLSIKNENNVDITNSTGYFANINPIRYRGYYYDTETGFYYLQSRYYDPANARFISADEPTIATDPSTVTDKNLFAYCDNDPINRFDNGGQFWNVIAGAVIGGVIGGASQAISNLIDGKPILQDVGISVAKGAIGGALTAIFPGASTTISVVMSVGESIESDIKNGENIQTIAVNAALSAGFAAATSNGTIFSNKNIMKDTFSAVKKVLPGNHPSVKRTAKKFLKNTCKALSREIKSGIADGVFVNEVRDATEWYTGLYTGSKSTYRTLERANR